MSDHDAQLEAELEWRGKPYAQTHSRIDEDEQEGLAADAAAEAAYLRGERLTAEQRAEIARAREAQQAIDAEEAELLRIPDVLLDAVRERLLRSVASAGALTAEQQVAALHARGFEARSSGDADSIGWHIPADLPRIGQNWEWIGPEGIAYLDDAGAVKWREFPHAKWKELGFGFGTTKRDRRRRAAAAEAEAAAAARAAAALEALEAEEALETARVVAATVAAAQAVAARVTAAAAALNGAGRGDGAGRGGGAGRSGGAGAGAGGGTRGRGGGAGRWHGGGGRRGGGAGRDGGAARRA